ncbi:MAG: hypothetical protein GY862_07485 [Gammaproteobacteria bacterium]|nr:hypothetical protein [Gammaproteobacteria bacterium]
MRQARCLTAVQLWIVLMPALCVVLVPALCAARPGYALRAASLHLSRAAGCQTARSAECRVPCGAPEPGKVYPWIPASAEMTVLGAEGIFNASSPELPG